MIGSIEVRGLSRTFHTTVRRPGFTGAVRSLVNPERVAKDAVSDITFDVSPGELLALLGPNGAGKSTTIKMLTGILTPTSGEARVAGVVPYQERERNARNIGAVFGQRTQLWWDLPVRESFAILRDIYDVPEAEHRTRLREFDELLDLSSFWDTRVRHLSLGQRVRSDLAAALLHDPPVVFLDEPTIGMDVVVKEQVREFLRYQVEERGRTVLLTTHDMTEVERLAERVVLINHGRLVLDGTLDEIRRKFGSTWQVRVTLADPHDARRGAAGDGAGAARRPPGGVRTRRAHGAGHAPGAEAGHRAVRGDRHRPGRGRPGGRDACRVRPGGRRVTVAVLQGWRAARVTPLGELHTPPRMTAALLRLTVQVVLVASLWHGLYAATGTTAGLSEDQAVTYAVLAVLATRIRELDQYAGRDTVLQHMHFGTIIYWYLRPLPPQRYYALRALGEQLYGLVWVLAGYAICLAAGVVDPPRSAAVAGVFAVSAFLGQWVLYYVMLAIDQLCFWTLRNGAAMLILIFAQNLLSGVYAPLWFFPGLVHHHERLPAVPGDAQCAAVAVRRPNRTVRRGTAVGRTGRLGGGSRPAHPAAVAAGRPARDLAGRLTCRPRLFASSGASPGSTSAPSWSIAPSS